MLVLLGEKEYREIFIINCKLITPASFIMELQLLVREEHLTQPRRVRRIRERFLGRILKEELARF